MDQQQQELYRRIQAFNLDAQDAAYPFSQRLAHDNRWSLPFARRVVAEYKRFAFLAMAAGHPVTPSEQVDQAWHLHLLYTRSYWLEFCPNVLGKPLHHGPTQGGEAERKKYLDWYGNTLASYQRLLGQTPPGDIWPAPNIRFGHDLNAARVNLQDYWLVPKNPDWKNWAGCLLRPFALR